MTLNPKRLNKPYTGAPFEIDKREALFFALACGEDNAVYFDDRCEGGVIVPPMFAVRYAHGPVSRIIRDPEVGINAGAIVHYSQSFRWLAPVRPGDTIYSEAAVTHITTQKKGGIIGISVRARNQRSEPVVEAVWELFDKSAGAEGAKRPASMAPPSGSADWVDDIEIPLFQTFIYAEASGDRNPIHLNDTAAGSIGLPGILVHGLYTMALAQKRIVDHACLNADPLLLQAMYMRFSRPVFPGDRLTFQSIAAENRIRQYLTVRNQEGRDVVRDAWYELKES